MKRLGLLLLGLLVACGGQKLPDARPIIIPPTTKVMDAATRAALTAYTPATGTLRFSQSTPALAALKPDDVLVSEPSAAAPDGYLRKVKAIRQEGNEVVLETTQANLTDAISQGDLTAQYDLQPTDLRPARVFVRGLTIGPAPQVAIGDGYRFQAKFDQTVLDINEGDVKVKVRVDGNLYFNAGYNISIGIAGVDPLKGRFHPELDRFEAWIGFDQAARLHVSGEANAKVTKEKKVAEIPYTPKCFSLGPIPVCVVPTVYVFVGASGEVKLSFDYAVTQKASARIGAKWDDSNGWSQIKPSPSFNTSLDQKFNVAAELNFKAWAKTEGALKLYGVAGPTIGAKLGLELDAKFKRNPFWIARGQLEAYYGFIVDLPIIGRLSESSGTIYSLSSDVGTSPNSPPIIIIRQSYTRVDLGQPVFLGFFLSNGECDSSSLFCVIDPEDGVPPFTLTSDLDGLLTPGKHTFANPGLRTLTIQAQDSQGAKASASFRIEVVNTPPVAFGSVGTDTVPATVPYYVSGAASDPNSGKLGCDALFWSVTAPDTVRALNLSNGVCVAEAVFNVQGSRSVTLTARDPQGAVSSPRVFNVYVTAPPPNPAPRITRMSVKDSDGYEVAEGSRIRGGWRFALSIQATDPNGDPITYRWEASCGRTNNLTPFAIPSNPDGTATFVPHDYAPCKFVASSDEVKVIVTGYASDGITEVLQTRAFTIWTENQPR